MEDTMFGYWYTFGKNELTVMFIFMVGYRHVKPKYGLHFDLITREVTEIRDDGV